MSFSERKIRLLARNEGKIKSYDSCLDIRAWSHDCDRQDRYLKEWMKCDMPICIVPLSTVLGFLKNMTCGSRKRYAPRCHPDCKSKVVLDSINDSCQAMRDCLKEDVDLENFLIEEDLETSHWPCDRCLQALRNIKLFWKIMLQKFFNINLGKSDCFASNVDYSCEGVREIAKSWQSEMMEQVMFVKDMCPELACSCSNQKKSQYSIRARENCCIPRKQNYEGDRTTVICPDTSEVCSCVKSSIKHTGSSTSNCKLKTQKQCCRAIWARVETADVCCSTTCSGPVTAKEVIQLRQENMLQKAEYEKLKKEHALLKYECLKASQDTCCWPKNLKYNNYTGSKNSCQLALVPKKKESCKPKSRPPKDAESEMVITLQNCKNEEGYRQVSLLQVLHKTNNPLCKEVFPKGPCARKEDPVYLLNKVQSTLGEMVKREMAFARKKKCCPDLKTSDIEATFHTYRSINPTSTTTRSTNSSSYCTLS